MLSLLLSSAVLSTWISVQGMSPSTAQTMLSEIPFEAEANTIEYYDMDGGSISAPIDELNTKGIGCKVVYDAEGLLNNVYYPDAQEPSGYSIHNMPMKSSNDISEMKTYRFEVPNNTEILIMNNDSFLLERGVSGSFSSEKRFSATSPLSPFFCKEGDRDVFVSDASSDSKTIYYLSHEIGTTDSVIQLSDVSSNPWVCVMQKHFSNLNILP